MALRSPPVLRRLRNIASMAYLVAYDIADDHRREQIARVLLDYGERVQESVFWLDADMELRERMTTRLKRIISETEDILWIVPACNRCAPAIITLGTRRVPDTPEFYIVKNDLCTTQSINWAYFGSPSGRGDVPNLRI